MKRKSMTSSSSESTSPIKIPKTMLEKESTARLIVVLCQASLETVKIGKSL
ncbi:hypothetical protein HMI55_004169 [Coelomomyces lativittatus]|nr:hypothetical protein HMI55_004169 [Coelomomyces lativittatus]